MTRGSCLLEVCVTGKQVPGTSDVSLSLPFSSLGPVAPTSFLPPEKLNELARVTQLVSGKLGQENKCLDSWSTFFPQHSPLSSSVEAIIVSALAGHRPCVDATAFLCRFSSAQMKTKDSLR